jgi:hypothetical protein
MANRQVVHGGAAAQKQITAGVPLTGRGREVLAQVLNDYDQYGRAAMVEAGALELETVGRLYLESVQSAFALGQHERFHQMVKTWAYLRVAALRAWAQVKDEQLHACDVIDYGDAMQAAKEATGGDGDE